MATISSDLSGVLFDAIDQGVCVIEMIYDAAGRAIDYRFVLVNAAFEAQTGMHSATGRTMREFAPEFEEHWFERYGRVAETGDSWTAEMPAAALGRWFEVFAFRVEAPEHHLVAVIFSDITQRKAVEDRASLLGHEMNHRLQNSLSVVASLVRLTKAGTVDEFRKTLLGRVDALSASQKLLLESEGRGAEVARILEVEMAGFGEGFGDRVSWSGPKAALDHAAAQGLALAVHELATNATKYGALSEPRGRVAIVWTVRDDGLLEFCWREMDGPKIMAPPERQGVGTGVISRAVHESMDRSDAIFDWRPDGLKCTLTLRVKTKQVG